MKEEGSSKDLVAEIQRSILIYLEKKSSSGRVSVFEMRGLMGQVVELSHLLQRDGHAPAELQDFRVRFTELMSRERNLAEMDVYLFDCLCYAQRGDLNGFEPACWMRSSAQILHDVCVDWNHPGSAAIRELFEEHIEEIDETIRLVSWDAPPVPEEKIPDWVPESHWWWRAPMRKDMSPEERDRRINYELYDAIDDLESKESRRDD
ncbi:hypothetical protein NI17_017460 [Thermobifida halotolerans]|uniref:Uncharacterized protein n=1 Tax=Thermobifida halotolerans TaxID=483545 RepID=A0AA97LV19_9ACTN|nr:hypothetical protein [Thermobifida halotolerans]UOE18589.1 hypothetical protein NI17_017460 [Thermobifida halotolerans]